MDSYTRRPQVKRGPLGGDHTRGSREVLIGAIGVTTTHVPANTASCSARHWRSHRSLYASCSAALRTWAVIVVLHRGLLDQQSLAGVLEYRLPAATREAMHLTTRTTWSTVSRRL